MPHRLSAMSHMTAAQGTIRETRRRIRRALRDGANADEVALEVLDRLEDISGHISAGYDDLKASIKSIPPWR